MVIHGPLSRALSLQPGRAGRSRLGSPSQPHCHMESESWGRAPRLHHPQHLLRGIERAFMEEQIHHLLFQMLMWHLWGVVQGMCSLCEEMAWAFQCWHCFPHRELRYIPHSADICSLCWFIFYPKHESPCTPIWELLPFLLCSGQRTVPGHFSCHFSIFACLFLHVLFLPIKPLTCSWLCLSCSGLNAGWCLKWQLGTGPVMGTAETTNNPETHREKRRQLLLAVIYRYRRGLGKPLISYRHIPPSVKVTRGRSNQGMIQPLKT